MIQKTSKVVITGAAQGIGRALARHFAEKGHKIFLLDVDKEKLQHTAEVHLKQYSSQIAWAVCDLTDTDAIRETVKTAAKHLDGRIDCLINNAGISHPYWPDDKTMEDPSTLDMWKKYVDVNLTGNFVISQACIPYMKVTSSDEMQKLPESEVGTAGPCIVMVGSFRGTVSDEDQEGYAATKAGLIGLATSMAVSLKRAGIRVNLVSPGRIRATHENRQGDEDNKVWANEDGDEEDHLTNRSGMPDDIVEAVEYMLGAGFVTGQNLVVDGGVTVKKAS